LEDITLECQEITKRIQDFDDKLPELSKPIPIHDDIILTNCELGWRSVSIGRRGSIVRCIQLMHLRYMLTLNDKPQQTDNMDLITNTICDKYPDLKWDRVRYELKDNQWIGKRIIKLKNIFGWSILFFDCINASKIRGLKSDFAKSILGDAKGLANVKETFPDDAMVRNTVRNIVMKEVGNEEFVDRMLNEIDTLVL
jgi:hypothetical protein